MGLKHLKNRTDTVETSDGDSFSVRGLDLVDIIHLVEAHHASLSALFKLAESGGVESLMADFSAVTSALFSVAPDAVVQIIALGANEEDFDLVRLLSAEEQIDAISKIAKLTFRSTSPKKLMDTIIQVMRAMTAQMQSQ